MRWLVAPCAVLAAACATPAAGPPDASVPPMEAISLLGDTLRRPVADAAAEARMRAQRDSARIAWEADTSSADLLVWYGRRVAYLGQYGDAMDLFSLGHDRWPDDPRFLRHRGHRHLTTRQLDRAAADFERAAALVEGRPDEVEPDGMPNARGIPTSTLQSNIFYHLALTRYLQGDFDAALAAWSRPVPRADNPDHRVANGYWRYLTLRRLGRHEEAAAMLAPFTAELDVIENTAYHRLLLLFRGEVPADSLLAGDGDGIADATTMYGVAAWHLVEGRADTARALFERIVQETPWAAFGHLAAEAELARN